MRKTILALSPFLWGSLFCHAQRPDIPIDPWTGRMNFGIPVWNASEGDLSVPVGIFYSGGGVRVEQGEGTAGMGWNVSAGGAVTRHVRGLPDDYTGTGSDTRRGWLYESLAQTINDFTPVADENYTTCSDEGSDYDFLADLYYNDKDTEPDLFNFYAPGLFGQFVFGTDGLPKVIPFQDLKVTVTRGFSGEISTIEIQNNIGITYTFGASERGTKSATTGTGKNYLKTASNNFSEPLNFNYAWHLSGITSPSGAGVSLHYTTSAEPSYNKDYVVVVDDNNVTDTIYSILDEINTKFISQIVTDASDINFIWQDGRIKQIDVVDNETNALKSHSFNYEYIKDYRETESGIKRAFLKEIYQNGNCNSFPSYLFTYDNVSFAEKTTQLPFKSRLYQDLWGYYNGTSADKKPDIYVYDAQTDGERYRINDIPGQPASSHLTGSARNVNPETIASGSLIRIEYPSGAFALIDYEPNSYFDAAANATYLGAGIRVRRVSIKALDKGSEDIITEYEYTKTDGQSSGNLLYPPVFAFGVGGKIIRAFDNLAPDGGVVYSRVTVKQTGKGKTVYDFVNPGVYPSTSESGWSAAKNRFARFQKPQEPGQPVPPCVSLGNQLSGYYLFPFAPNLNYDYARGLPDRITDYAETGTPVQERIYSYQSRSLGSTLIKGLKYEPLDSNFVYSVYTLRTGQNKAILTETVRRADDINPSIWTENTSTYAYSSIHQLLESVSTTNSDGVIYKSRYRYAKDFNALTDPDPANPETVALKALNDSQRHGEMIETIQTRNAGDGEGVTGASLLLFKDYGNNRVLPHRSLVFPATTGFTEATVTGSPQALIYDTDYIPVITYETYTGLGQVQSSSDNRMNRSGLHYGFHGSVPVAAISNAFAEEVVLNDFESNTGFQLSVSGPAATSVEGWTGNYALSIGASNVLSRQLVKKGGASYRFSCWVKADAATQLTISALAGSVTQASGTVSYASGALGQWQYLESEIDMGGVSDPFTFEVSTSAAAVLDDIRFYPANAIVRTTTYSPFKGVTSATDDRGVSSFTEYDPLGRVKYIKDRFKNILQVNDYRYRKEVPASLVAAFSGALPEGGIVKNDPVLFTATDNSCLTGVSYQWYVSDGTTETLAGTTPELTYSFPAAGYYTLRLRVESTEGYWDEAFAEYCVKDAAIIGTLKAMVDEPFPGCTHPYTELYECESGTDSYIRVLHVNESGCRDLEHPSYAWYYKFSGMNDWAAINGEIEKTLTFNLYDYPTPESFQIKVVMTGKCADGQYPCFPSSLFSAEQIIAFTYFDEQFCP